MVILLPSAAITGGKEGKEGKGGRRGRGEGGKGRRGEGGKGGRGEGGEGGRWGAILAAFNRVNTVTQRPSCIESLSVATACERKDIVSHSSMTLSFRNSPCGLPAFIGSIAT